MYLLKVVYLFLHVWTSVTFKILSVWCNTPIKIFFTAQNGFWIYQFWCLVVLLSFCLFVSPMWIGKTFPFEESFHLEKQQSCLGQDRVNRKGRAWGSYRFWSKLLNTQHSVGRCTHKSPIVKWANALEESSKEDHWSPTQPLTTRQLVCWYRWVPRTLT